MPFLQWLESFDLSFHGFCKIRSDLEKSCCFKGSFKYNQFIEIDPQNKISYGFLDDSTAINSGVPT